MAERHLATIDSVMPIIGWQMKRMELFNECIHSTLDVAKRDAHRLYLSGWTSHPNWLRIREAPILHCHDQGRAAWSALEAVQWTNGSGVIVFFASFYLPHLNFSWMLLLGQLVITCWPQSHASSASIECPSLRMPDSGAQWQALFPNFPFEVNFSLSKRRRHC